MNKINRKQYRNRVTDTWNRPTVARGKQEGGYGWKKRKGLAEEHIRMTHGHRQQCGGGQREGGEGWVEVGKGGENADICHRVNNKNEVK